MESRANPDVLVAYHASLDKNLEITGSAHGSDPLVSAETGCGRRGFSRFWSERLSSTYSESRTGAIVWRSLASSDIRPTDKPESRDKKVAKATEKMFKHYPREHGEFR